MLGNEKLCIPEIQSQFILIRIDHSRFVNSRLECAVQIITNTNYLSQYV